MDWEWERVPAPPGVPGPAWRLRGAGQEVLWAGMSTGPLVLSDGEVSRIAQELLGVPLSALEPMAARELRPDTSGRRRPALLVHSATRAKRMLEGDLSDLAAGRQPYDAAGYIEARAAYLARPGDLVVGRAQGPGPAAAARAGAERAGVGHQDWYYLSQALLLAAVEHQRAGGGPLARLAGYLRARPDAVVRLYALDTDMQLFLLWLKRQAGLDVLRTDANSPAITATWSRKGHLHPRASVAGALGERLATLSAHEALAVEHRHSQLAMELGPAVNAVPGYTIARAGREEAEFVEELLLAARLLATRYQILTGCLKPSESGGGARITRGIDLRDSALLRALGREAYRYGDDYLLEANVAYRRLGRGEHAVLQAPSGHIGAGRVEPGLTAQILNGTFWEGNAYVDERTCASLGLAPSQYLSMRAQLAAIHDAFRRGAGAGAAGGLVTGGIDFAFGTVGGRFGDEVLIAPTDFNLLSHGAAYLRAFLDRAASPYAATHVFRPTWHATADAIEDALDGWSRAGGGEVAVIASVPGRWAMVAAAGSGTLEAVANVSRLVAHLAGRGLAVPER